MTERMKCALFSIGDYLAGGLTGALAAASVRVCVPADTDMVLAMLLGMAVGMAVHFLLLVLLAPVLGSFHVMVPGGLIGMYGGMLFAMRDTMQHPPSPLGQALGVGVVFGIVVVASVHLYDWALKASPTSGAVV